MPNTKKAKPAKLPRHWSEAKNEAQEATWWDKNASRLTREAAQRGALQQGTIEELLADMKKAQRDQTTPLSIRFATADIERAKAQAQEKGLGYQTYIKSLLHQALAADNPAANRAAAPKSKTAGKVVMR
jgi:predicted DNA binding CopG/RHH family protein